MLSTNTCMASDVANFDDGSFCETVLRYFDTPTPAQYTFEFDARIQDEGQPLEENLVVDEYLFKAAWRVPGQLFSRMQQPHRIPMQSIHSKTQRVELKQAAVDQKSDGKHMHPLKFLKLTEVEMVQCLRRWKERLSREPISESVTITEADVYALHPADLIKGACTHYFYSATKYSSLKRPTRLRITENGCRWKQQGRIFPIRENGQTVAFKTYLSYVALKKGKESYKKSSLASASYTDRSTSKDMVCERRERKWSLWTMEEIGLAEDVQSERLELRRGGRPRPFPVVCRIVCKRDGHTSARRKPEFRDKESQEAVEVLPNPHDIDVSARAAGPPKKVPMISEVSCLAGTASTSLTNAQGILEDEIIRALIYELPYGNIRTAAITC